MAIKCYLRLLISLFNWDILLALLNILLRLLIAFKIVEKVGGVSEHKKNLLGFVFNPAMTLSCHEILGNI